MLEDLRSRAATHVGLAADEALLRAAGRGQLSARGVAVGAASLARGGSLSPADRGRASLARSVVQLYSGSARRRLATSVQGGVAEPAWDRLSRELAIEVAVDAGDRALVRRLLDAAGLSAEDVEVYRAWSEYEQGPRRARFDVCPPWISSVQGWPTCRRCASWRRSATTRRVPGSRGRVLVSGSHRARGGSGPTRHSRQRRSPGEHARARGPRRRWTSLRTPGVDGARRGEAAGL